MTPLDQFLDRTTEDERRIYFMWKDATSERAQLIFKMHSSIILKVESARMEAGLPS